MSEELAESDLLRLRHEAAAEADRRRQTAAAQLRQIYRVGEAVARKLDEWEVRMMLEAHRRVPAAYLGRIDPLMRAADFEEDERFLPPCNFACMVAGELERLVFVGSDLEFQGPANRLELDRAADLLDKLAEFSPAESAALEVLLTASQLCFVATLSYDMWWHPPMLLRFLSNPELDRLPHHL